MCGTGDTKWDVHPPPQSCSRYDENQPCVELEIQQGAYTPTVCTPAKVRGRVGILVFWGKSKYSWFQGGCPMREGGRGISLGQVSSFYVHFPILKCKDSKIEKFNIHIFIFKIHARFQIGKDYNTESKFSCSRNSLFSSVSGYSKPTKPIKLLSFWFIWYV